jgi:hypothetical protein
MAIYRVLKSVAFTKEDGSSAMVAVSGATVDIGDDAFAQSLVDAGRIVAVEAGQLPTGTVLDGDVALVDDESTVGTPSESSTNADLVDYLVANGVKRSTVEHLKKADLLEAIDRLTHTDDDD